MESVNIELKPIHWDLLTLVRTLCYEGLPETRLSRIDPTDFRLPLWDLNPYVTRFTVPNGVPEPFVSSCFFSTTDEVALQRWGGADYTLGAALQYLIDRGLLGMHHENQPVCAAFRNFFGDSEILSTIVIEENENGRFYVWRTPAVHLVLKQHAYPLVCCLPFAVFKVTEPAQKLLDVKKAEREPEKPTDGKPPVALRTDTLTSDNLKPSHRKAKALYEWAMEHIEGAEKMTYAELFDKLTSD